MLRRALQLEVEGQRKKWMSKVKRRNGGRWSKEEMEVEGQTKTEEDMEEAG